MKNLAKILVVGLLVGLFGVVAVSSLLATPSIQTPLVATTSYNEETGIRWNEGFGVFEVFNANGISYIASGAYFDASGTKGISTENGMVIADGTKTYNIMQDIAYNPSDVTNLETAFAGGTRHSITTGAVNGRGFILKNFPIIATATAGTALFRSNGGTIQNLILENPTYTDGTANTGILVYENKGVIDGCEVKGTISTTNVINIASIAYTGNGTIRNSTNYLNITTAGSFAAGILANAEDSIVFNCMNYGNITANTTATRTAGGIVGRLFKGSVQNNINYGNITSDNAGGILGNSYLSIINGNVNYGAIEGVSTACGIIGGDVYGVTEKGNVNYGTKTAPSGKTDDIYAKDAAKYGINFVELVEGTTPKFEVTSMIGLSYIGSGLTFSTTGEMKDAETPGAGVASTAAIYHIVNDIEYSRYGVRSEAPIVVAGTMKVYGMKPAGESGTESVNLTNFPIRQIGTTSTYTALFESIAAEAEVKNINLHIDTTFPTATSTGNIGVFSYENNGLIENGTLTGGKADELDDKSRGTLSTTSRFDIGGFAYTNSGTPATKFEKCTNNLNITSAAIYLSGIMGFSSIATFVTFKDCVNKGDLDWSPYNTTNYSGVGGIGGMIVRSETIGCKNEAKIVGDLNMVKALSYAGGIVGFTQFASSDRDTFSGSIELSGSITNGVRLGGFTGVTGGSAELTVKVVDFLSEETSLLSYRGLAKDLQIGGVIGRVNTSTANIGDITSTALGETFNFTTSAAFYNCSVGGKVMLTLTGDGQSVRMGGIVGWGTNSSENFSTMLRKCTFEGDLVLVDEGVTSIGTITIGGLFGLYEASTSLLREISFVGNHVETDIAVPFAEAYLGGVVGLAQGSGLIIEAVDNTVVGSITIPTDPDPGDFIYRTGTFAGTVNNAVANAAITVLGGATAPSNRAIGNQEYIAPPAPEVEE